MELTVRIVRSDLLVRATLASLAIVSGRVTTICYSPEMPKLNPDIETVDRMSSKGWALI